MLLFAPENVWSRKKFQCLAMPLFKLILGENGRWISALRFMPNVLGFWEDWIHPSPVSQSEINRMLGTADEY
jgi:transcriptional antiterminator NusG